MYSLGGSLIYTGISMCLTVKCSKWPKSHLSPQLSSKGAWWALCKDGWVSWCQNSFCSSSEWLEKAGRTSSSHLLENDLSHHNLSMEDATQLALDRPLWSLLTASGAMHWKCKPNNDDNDDDSDILLYSVIHPGNEGCDTVSKIYCSFFICFEDKSNYMKPKCHFRHKFAI